MSRFAALPVPVTLTIMLLLAACGAPALTSAPASPPPGASPSPSAAEPPGTAGPSGSATGAASPGAATAGAGGDVWLPDWADAAVPAAVRARDPLHFCGIEQAPAPVPGEFIDAIVRACFWDAWQNDAPAEFVSVQSTMEGSPIATIWRTNGDGTIDLLVDMTQDQFGSGGWAATRCRSLVEDTEGNAFFGVDDCGESAPLP